MADRGKPPSNAGTKPVPMKLFATWEVDRTPPNCIPRLCSLTLTRLVLLKPLGSDLSSIVIAVKMQSSKRTLRSNEIILPSNELLDTELDLTFSLQYPHFLKRDGNKLQIMLQRRKKYKNRTILGFKTLAVGIVNMAQILQKSMDKELELYTDLKEKSSVMAKVMMLTLSSQPVDHEEAEQRKLSTLTEPASPSRVVLTSNCHKLTSVPPLCLDRSVDADNFSDEDEDFSSNEEGSDSEPMLDDGVSHPRLRKVGQRQSLPAAARAGPSSAVTHGIGKQRNLKQKFIALLKRFKVTDEGLDSEHDHEEAEQKSEHEMDPQEIEALFEELEDLSDSGPDMDTMSIVSTPKPSLRPFFPSSRSLVQEGLNLLEKPSSDRLSDESSKKADSDSHQDVWLDQEQSESQQVASNPPVVVLGEERKVSSEKRPKLFTRDKSTPTTKEKRISLTKDKGPVERSNSLCQLDSSPRKILLEQLTKVFPSEDFIPDYIILVNAADIQSQIICQRLQEKQQRILCTGPSADVKASMSCLVGKIQKFCNTNSKAPLPIKVVILGNDSYIHSVLRSYVEQFASKPSEWQSYIKFLVIPTGVNTLAKYLGSVDSVYYSTFLDAMWRDSIDKSESQKTDCQELVNRVSRYINSSSAVLQIPIAEAMVTYKEKRSDEESNQIFIPFINDVKIGVSETSGTQSVDIEEATSATSIMSSSPPASNQLDKPKENITPPSSPNISGGAPLHPISSQSSQTSVSLCQEHLDLQIDYWITQIKGDSNKKSESNKNTLKSTFRSLQFLRLPSVGETGSSAISMSYVSKEKKQKIMRLGKKKEKEKESDSKNTVVEGINRLICLARTQPLKVCIDGTDWHGVKFFQLSSQWQTHIKHFPVALFSHSESAL